MGLTRENNWLMESHPSLLLPSKRACSFQACHFDLHLAPTQKGENLEKLTSIMVRRNLTSLGWEFYQ